MHRIPFAYDVETIRVVDGDTVDLTVVTKIDVGFRQHVTHRFSDRFRLFGIDAPEVRGTEREAGLKTKLWLEERVRDRKLRAITFKDRRGKYGRWLCKLCEVTDKDPLHGELIDITHEMVTLGLAVHAEY